MKSEHLETQKLLAASLEGAEMEVSLPQLRRRADVLWVPEKTVFEVQCSPISGKEVLSRTSDYACYGYRVIWVLHDALYNKAVMTGAERVMQGRAHLFSSVDAKGRGGIYEQRAKTRGLKRIHRAEKELLFGSLKPNPFWWLDALVRRLCTHN